LVDIKLLEELGEIMYLMLMELFILLMLVIHKDFNKVEINYKVSYKCHNYKKCQLLFLEIKSIKLVLFHKFNYVKHLISNKKVLALGHKEKVSDRLKYLCVVLLKKLVIRKGLNGLVHFLNDSIFHFYI
jgi:hypothetical protein